MNVLAGEINASLSKQTVATGLIKSACHDRKPLKIDQRPLWKETQGYFSWLLER
jgi:hypothetical protein